MTSLQPMTAGRPSPWGVGPTIAFGLIVALAFVATQILAAAVLFSLQKNRDPGLSLDSYLETIDSNGLLLSLSTWTTTLVSTMLVILFVRLRRQISFREYLHFLPVARIRLLRWLGIALFLALVYDVLSIILQRPIVPEYMIKVYETAGNIPLLWSAIVVAAPLSEEIFFRGFLLEGIRMSRLGSVGAVLLTSLIWTSIHMQYGLYELGHVFILGLVLAVARIKTQSLYTSLAIHIFLNFYATCEVAFLAGQGTL